MAREMWAEFFDETSPHQINLPNSGTNRLVTGILNHLFNIKKDLYCKYYITKR